MNSRPKARRAEPADTRERYELLVLVLIAFVTRALFIYHTSAPEPDTVAMVAGMAMGMSGKVAPGDALLYGRNVDPGMHLFAARVFPFLLGAPQHLMPFLNWLTVTCATLALIPFYALIRPRLGHTVAIACLAVWAFTPVVWESGTYYHPLVPAMLLLLLALVLARRIAATINGVLALVLVSLLASLAFVVRVEVAFVWPGLLAWTLSSRRRGRDTAVLFGVTTVAALVYLAGSRAVASTSEGLSVGGFLKVISRLYQSTFNLRGLPRSATWMALGMGIATLALCVWGLLRRSSEPGRILMTALAWALPSMLFWLPQPTPINRHYLLATMGIVVVAGVTLFSRLNGRRLVAAVVAVIVLNLAVPEIAYRAYNAQAQAPKTAHGSFFYYHATAARQIAIDSNIALRIATCSASGSVGSPPLSCALVRWEQFAHVAYALSMSGRSVIPETATTVFPGVREMRFRVDGGEVRLISYVYFEDQDLRNRIAEILRESQHDGYCLFAPNELRARVPELRAFGNSVQGY